MSLGLTLMKMIPVPLRSCVMRLAPSPLVTSQLCKIWKRTDLRDWPLPELVDKPDITRYEYSLFSQNGEDGILRYLFSKIGFRSRLFVEFGFGIIQNNSLRLILNEGFGGIFIDGSKRSVEQFNKAARRLGIKNIRAINQFLTLDNLENTIAQHGLPRDIDLLSIDVDGNDYWFWEKIDILSPRIVVIEYNSSLGPDLSLSVPYDLFLTAPGNTQAVGTREHH